MPQTVITQSAPQGIDGLIADTAFGNVKSLNLAGYRAKVGVAVCFADENGENIDTPIDNSKKVAGITVREATDNFLRTNKGEYNINEVVPVISRGTVWVRLHESSPDVKVGDAVFAKTQANETFENAGIITGENTTTDPDNIAIPSAQFASAGVAGELVKVEINLP